MTEQKAKKLIIISASVLLLLWQLIYYLGLVDTNRFSHPVGILQSLGDLDFLLGFGILFLVQWTLASLIGGWMGIRVAAVLIRTSYWTQAALHFLQIGLWLPFLIYWPLPLWPPREGYWANGFFSILVASVVAVSLSACYSSLSTQATVALKWRKVRPAVVKNIILQAFFISLISQMWMSPNAGILYFVTAERKVSTVYAALILLTAFLILMCQVFQFDFKSAAEARGKILLREVTSRSWSYLLGSFLFWGGFILLWQVFSSVGFYRTISSPMDTIKTTVQLFLHPIVPSGQTYSVWGNVLISFFEVLGGLSLGVGIAIVLCRILLKDDKIAKIVLPIFPLTYAIPILLPLVMLFWIPLVEFWWTLAAVGLVSFFPSAQVLFGVPHFPRPCQIFLAAYNAVPYAFVTMLFWEAMGAVAGLGFLAIISHDRHQVDEGLAAALLTIALLVALSSTIKWVAKKSCSRSLAVKETVSVECGT